MNSLTELALQMIGNVPEAATILGDLNTTYSADELNEMKADAYNEEYGDLAFMDCPVCRNKGRIAMVKDGRVCFADCSCVPIRKARKRIADSGLADQVTRYTFDAFIPAEPWQKEAKEAVERYAADPHGWLVITGRSGTGKTHLCTAACGELLKNMPVVYFSWRTDAPIVKALITDMQAYSSEIDRLTGARCLYIDDFFKGSITDADKNLAYTLIDKRYSDITKLTIISSELSFTQMMEVDEAIGGRIWERATVKLALTGKNYRTR